MKTYCLKNQVGLIIVLICGSVLFANHTVTGYIPLSDGGTCSVSVGTPYAYCEDCKRVLTTTCSGISCTGASGSGCGTWSLNNGCGEYEFEYSGYHYGAYTVGGTWIEEATGTSETIGVDLCEKIAIPSSLAVTNNTCDTMSVSCSTSYFNKSASSVGSGGSITISVKEGMIDEGIIGQTIDFSGPCGTICTVTVIEIDASTTSTPNTQGLNINFKSNNFAPPGNNGNNNCSDCSGSGGQGSAKQEYHNMNVQTPLLEEEALANQSQFLSTDGQNVEAKINLGNGLFRADARDGWKVEEYSDTIDTLPVTGFMVTDPEGSVYYYYEIGTEMPDFPTLKKIDRKTSDSNVDTIVYHYNVNDKLDYQEDEDGNKIEYSYDATTGKLEQLDFIASDQSVERTLEFTYNSDGILEEKDCSSCSNGQYSYYLSNEEYYDPIKDAHVPAHTYISEIKNAGGDIVAEFSYDEDDRIEEHDLGSLSNTPSNKLVVAKWNYTEDQGALEIERKDYVDSTNYRVSIYNYDANGTLQNIVKYHQLQTDSSYPSNPGDYSTTCYSMGTNPVTKITEYESGLKDVEEYDTNGWPCERYKEYFDGQTTHNLTQGLYTYTSHTNTGGESRYLLDSSTNAYSGTTSYTYNDAFGQVKAAGPTITSGITNEIPDSSDSRTVYDDLGRMKYEMQKVDVYGTNKWVGKEYIYESNGKIDKVKDGVVFTLNNEALDSWTVNTAVDDDAIVTDFSYTDFGELEDTAILDESANPKQIRRNFYDNKGVKIGEASLISSTEVITAVKYTYNADNLLVIKSAVKEDDKFLLSDLESDLDESLTVDASTNQVEGWSGLELTWIHTIYVYDDYGRRVSVIEDATQEGDTARNHLKTEYAYNNQGEIKEVKSPSGKVVRTQRDGRGLVKKEETGYYDSSTFMPEITVEYTYDDNGNLKTRTEPHPNGDGRKVKTVYVYDMFDRQKSTYTEVIPAP